MGIPRENKKKAEYEETTRLPKYAIISGLRSFYYKDHEEAIWRVVEMKSDVYVNLPTEARFKRRATAVPNSINFNWSINSTASLAVLHGSSSTWFQTSYYRRAELKS